jgi:SET domain-containing protein
MVSKEEFLDELTNNTFVIIKPSPVGGVGVFAVRDIPKGCRTIFSKTERTDQWINISRSEVDALPTFAKNVIYNYCLFDNDNYFVPAKGFKKMDLSHYLNHSEQSNVASISDGDFFEALRDIEAGEELLIDYGTIVEHTESDL